MKRSVLHAFLGEFALPEIRSVYFLLRQGTLRVLGASWSGWDGLAAQTDTVAITIDSVPRRHATHSS